MLLSKYGIADSRRTDVKSRQASDSLPKDWRATTQLSHTLARKAVGKMLFSVKEKEMWFSPINKL